MARKHPAAPTLLGHTHTHTVGVAVVTEAAVPQGQQPGRRLVPSGVRGAGGGLALHLLCRRELLLGGRSGGGRGHLGPLAWAEGTIAVDAAWGVDG
jgi:hypothetical protein